MDFLSIVSLKFFLFFLKTRFSFLLAELPHALLFFSVFIDTNSKISQFLPIDTPNSSFRRIIGSNLFPPILILQFVRNPVTSWWIDEKKAVHDLMVKQGRFLWYSSKSETEVLIAYGRGKLNNGVDPIFNSTILSKELAVAILASRVSLFFDYSIDIAESLINGHMGICFYVSKDRKYLWLCYPSETTLSLAAASILRGGVFSWGECVQKIQEYTKMGLVEAGYRGELVSKIILSATWDSCQTFETHKSVTVKDFLTELGGKQLIEALKINNCEEGEMNRFLKGRLFFTHFTYVAYTVTSEEELMNFCQKGQAIFCKLRQEAIDLIIPVILDSDTSVPRFTFIAVQCKNHLLYDSDGHGSAESTMTAERAGFKDWKLPYLVLFMSLGAYNYPDETPTIQSLIIPKRRNLNSKLLI